MIHLAEVSRNGRVGPRAPVAELTEAAVGYASSGWAVFPLHTVTDGRCSCGKLDCSTAGKHPRTRHGLKDATRDIVQIRAWWSAHPDSNIGVATGAVSGIVVLDVDVGDGKDGLLSLEHLEGEHGPLPETVESHTGGGGRHFFFRHPGEPIKNRVGIYPGIDIRADGGYVVAPPSIHASGQRYIFEASSAPDDLAVAEPPDWITGTATPPQFTGHPHAREAASGSIRKGKRNDTLTRLAGAMRGQGCTPDEIYAAIAAVNQSRCAPPLEDLDVRRIAQSIGRYPPSRSTFSGGTYWERDILKRMWGDPEALRLFQYLVSNAAWQDHRGPFNGLGVGQILTSHRKIADACAWLKNNELKAWNPSGVKRLLEKLIERGLIEVESTRHGTVITVVNYEQFKGFSAIGV